MKNIRGFCTGECVSHVGLQSNHNEKIIRSCVLLCSMVQTKDIEDCLRVWGIV